MYNKNILVLYKKQPALIKDFDGDKIVITFQAGAASPNGKKNRNAEQKVREKDIIPLSEKAVQALKMLFHTKTVLSPRLFMKPTNFLKATKQRQKRPFHSANFQTS